MARTLRMTVFSLFNYHSIDTIRSKMLLPSFDRHFCVRASASERIDDDGRARRGGEEMALGESRRSKRQAGAEEAGKRASADESESERRRKQQKRERRKKRSRGVESAGRHHLHYHCLALVSSLPLPCPSHAARARAPSFINIPRSCASRRQRISKAIPSR